MENIQRIGKLQKTYGLKGYLHLSIEIRKEVLLDELKFVLLSIQQQPAPFFIEDIQAHGDKLVVKFENISNEAEAKKLVNKEVFVLPEFIGESEEDIFDLVGFTVIDQVYGELGKITGIQEYPQHDVFVVDSKGKEVLLPATDELIEEIDTATKTLRYSAPEGLIEVYLGS